MGANLIAIWGPQMRRALLLYFTDHGVSNPDPGDVVCLTAIGINEIDRRNLGFKTTSFLGMSSLLVPALLDPNHIRHAEIVAAIQQCKSQFPTASMSLAKTKGALAETVKSAGAKLPLLGKSTKTFATLVAAKAPAREAKAGRKGGGTK
jgi:hypothetical protein